MLKDAESRKNGAVEETEIANLKTEFPYGLEVKVPRSDGSISIGTVIEVIKTKNGVRVKVIIEEKEGFVFIKFVRAEKLREANLS